jgi:predicted secreted protein
MSRETRETVDKDNVAGYATSQGGQRSYSISFENFLSEDLMLNTVTVNGLADLITLFEGESFAWKFTTDVTGDQTFSGTAILTDLSLTAPVEENSTVSGTLTGTGALVSAAVV